MTPTEYWNSIGRRCSKPPQKPFGWCSDTVSEILSKQEYIGDTINFRTTKKSFKNKKRIERPKEDWQIFKNTHPAIIDEKVYYLVQELRKSKRRPTRTGIISMFSGLVYCADCGEKLYYSATGNYKREDANFFCSSYRKNSDVCSAHYIRECVIYNLVLEDMRRVFSFVTTFEKEFARLQLESYNLEKRKELSLKRKELDKAKKRINDIDTLIQKLYEDNAMGKLSDERYATMSISLETEQKELKERVPIMEQELNTETDKFDNLQGFINRVKRITQPTELTPELVHEFIEKIVVSAPTKIDGKRYQSVEIHYNGVGVIKQPSAEEWEQHFQEKYLKTTKEKTA